MKTQIIALDPQEDYLSVRDKMSWSQAGRVLLTWPTEQPILTRLDLVLIQRNSAARGVQLGLVTRNAEVRTEAAELGIPVFDSTRSAQAARWRVSRRRRISRRSKEAPPDLKVLRAAAQVQPPAWINRRGVRLAAFIVSLLAVLSLLVYALPSARVSLIPQQQTQSLTLEVAASPNASDTILIGHLPTYPVSVVVEGRGSCPTSGKVLTPLKPAIGGIQFTNLTNQTVTVPSGTVVWTLGTSQVRFATDKSGQVPAGVGKTLILPATALTPGAAGNLPAGSLVAIEGMLGLQLSATNPAATHNGSDSLVQGPSEADQQTLRAQLTDELRQTAGQEMQSSLPAGDQALPLTLVYQRTQEEAFFPKAGQPGDTLELTLRLEFKGQAVAGADLRAFVIPSLDAELPSGFTPLAGTTTIHPASTPRLDEQGMIRWTITVQRVIEADIPPAEAISLLHGKLVDRARQDLFAALPLAEAPLVEITPAWWPRLPFAAFRILIVPLSER